MKLWRRNRDPERWERLRQAEADTSDLLERVNRVTGALLERQRHNHWTEAIDALLKGS